MSEPLPKAYADLAREPGPRMLTEFLKIYGVAETKGAGDTPAILSWAEAIGYGHVYLHDAVPWCGLTVAYVAAQAGWDHAPRGNPLWAQNWLSWGNPAPQPSLADVLVFGRTGGGHVAIYVGEDAEAYHILGGNQGDRVSFERKAKVALLGARRCPWRVNQPANVRRIFRAASGAIVGGHADA